MSEPIQYDFEFVTLARSPWIAPIAKGMAAFFYFVAISGAVVWHILAGICLLTPDSRESRAFLAEYQSGMIWIAHFAVMAIASALVSGLFRSKDRIRIRAQLSLGETAPPGPESRR